MTHTRKQFKTRKLHITKNDINTKKFFNKFVKSNKRLPTMFETAYHFKLKSVSAAWEKLERIKNQANKCLLCNK